MPISPTEDTLDDDRSDEDTDLEQAPEQVDDEDLEDDADEGDADESEESDAEADDEEAEPEEAETEDSVDEDLTAKSEDQGTDEVLDPAKLKQELEEWRKRFSGIKQNHDLMAQKLKSFERYQDVDLDAATAAYKAQKEQARTDVWDPKHPEHTVFQSAVNKLDIYQQMRAKAEDPAAVDRLWNNQFSDAESAMLERWQSHQKDFQRRFAQAPTAVLEDMVTQRVNSVLEQRMAFEKANSHYQQFFQRGDVQSVLSQHRDEFGSLLQRGILPEEALDLLKSRHAAASTAEAGAAAAQSASRQRERERLAKGKAASTARSHKPTQSYDALQEARKEAKRHGIGQSGPMWNALLAHHSSIQYNLENEE